MKKPLLRKIGIALALLLISELLLRALGFGSAPVYYRSAAYEYALQPNQRMQRFGNDFCINAQGMRSAPLHSGEQRVLKMGDSVLNGGLATDQDALASTILDEWLAKELSGGRVLNVSAGSWGPQNCWAWLQAHGNFEAKVLVLIVNSDDWSDAMTFKDVVGNVDFYREKQPATALLCFAQWLYSRYLHSTNWAELTRWRKPSAPEVPVDVWAALRDYSEVRAIPLLVYHHPSLEEASRAQWSAKGQALEAHLAQLGIACISGLAQAPAPDMYRDAIHPNEAGQAHLAAVLKPSLLQAIAYDCP